MKKEPDCKPCRVMVVDDDPTNLLLAEEVIRLMGAEPITRASGASALPEILNGQVDLVFTDVQMPSLDGLELTRRVRTQEAALLRPRIPIIALTARAMPHELEACLRQGMDDVMTKPLIFEEFRKKLEWWCTKLHRVRD